MDLADLERQSDAEFEVPLSLWVWANLLGHARWKSNQDRPEHQDRGHAKNLINDIQGSFGELFLLTRIRRGGEGGEAVKGWTEAQEWITRHAFTAEGGRGDTAQKADLSFTAEDAGRRIGIDVKSFDFGDRKRYFAINARKHEKLRGSCDFYYCLLVPMFARRLIVARLVPYDEVESWEEHPLGGYGAPGRVLRIQQFYDRHLSEHHLPGVKRLGRGAAGQPEICYPGAAVATASLEPRFRDAFLHVFPAVEEGWLPREACRTSAGETCPWCQLATRGFPR